MKLKFDSIYSKEEKAMTNIQKTEAFLREQFAGCVYFKEHPADGEYRLQHSYRVAYAARRLHAGRAWMRRGW